MLKVVQQTKSERLELFVRFVRRIFWQTKRTGILLVGVCDVKSTGQHTKSSEKMCVPFVFPRGYVVLIVQRREKTLMTRKVCFSQLCMILFWRRPKVCLCSNVKVRYMCSIFVHSRYSEQWKRSYDRLCLFVLDFHRSCLVTSNIFFYECGISFRFQLLVFTWHSVFWANSYFIYICSKDQVFLH